MNQDLRTRLPVLVDSTGLLVRAAQYAALVRYEPSPALTLIMELRAALAATMVGLHTHEWRYDLARDLWACPCGEIVTRQQVENRRGREDAGAFPAGASPSEQGATASAPDRSSPERREP